MLASIPLDSIPLTLKKYAIIFIEKVNDVDSITSGKGMILKASQRGGARQLGLHLLKTEENEHVEVYEIRGYVADTVPGAMKETQAIAMGTQCKQPLFSLSANPPEDADVAIRHADCDLLGSVVSVGVRDGLLRLDVFMGALEVIFLDKTPQAWSRYPKDGAGFPLMPACCCQHRLDMLVFDILQA